MAIAETGTLYFLGNTQISSSFLGNTPIVFNSFTNPYFGFDNDAAQFCSTANVTGSAADAVNTLVLSLKSNNIWNNLYAVYPMVGANATSHKYNLKNPQDTDAAYRLNFAGGWTHDSSGAKPDGVSGTYADTFLVPNGLLASTSASISYFSFTNNAASDDVEIGCNDGASATKESLLALRFSDSNQYAFLQQVGASGGVPGTSAGFLVANAEGTAVRAWRNGGQVVNAGGTPQGFSSRSFYLAAQNNGTTSYRNSSRGCSFASIGGDLTGKMGTFSTIVNTFQSNLGRTIF